MNSQYLKVGGFCLQLQLPPNQFRIIGCFSFDCYDTGIDWTVLKRYRLVRSAKFLSFGHTATTRDTTFGTPDGEKLAQRRHQFQFEFIFFFKQQHGAELFLVSGLHSGTCSCYLCPGIYGGDRLGGYVGTHRLTARPRLAVVIR